MLKRDVGDHKSRSILSQISDCDRVTENRAVDKIYVPSAFTASAPVVQTEESDWRGFMRKEVGASLSKTVRKGASRHEFCQLGKEAPNGGVEGDINVV